MEQFPVGGPRPSLPASVGRSDRRGPAVRNDTAAGGVRHPPASPPSPHVTTAFSAPVPVPTTLLAWRERTGTR